MGQIVSRESSAIRQRKYSVKVLLDKILHEDDEGVANTPILPPTPRNIKGNPEIFGSHQKSPRSPNGMDKKKGPMRVNWCMKCGEYATRRLTDWIVMTDTEGNTYYLYECPHCMKENFVKIRRRRG